MKKRFIINCIALLLGGFAFGQNINPSAKKALDEMSALYHKTKTSYFKFSFQSTTMNNNKVQTGLYYQMGGKYLLKIMNTEQLFDGTKIHIINKEEQEVSIAKPNTNNQPLSPMVVFGKYQKGYSIQFINSSHIALKPQKEENVKQIVIEFNPKTKQIIAVKQYDLDGSVSVLKIISYQANLNLNIRLFEFNKKKYANYLVTEL